MYLAQKQNFSGNSNTNNLCLLHDPWLCKGTWRKKRIWRKWGCLCLNFGYQEETKPHLATAPMASGAALQNWINANVQSFTCKWLQKIKKLRGEGTDFMNKKQSQKAVKLTAQTQWLLWKHCFAVVLCVSKAVSVILYLFIYYIIFARCVYTSFFLFVSDWTCG